MDATQDERDDATEGAQNVVDRVTCYHYSGNRSDIESELDLGMDEAGVELDADERERLVGEIEDVKQDESRGTPVVERAEPSPDQLP